jgi:hypothetical protein
MSELEFTEEIQKEHVQDSDDKSEGIGKDFFIQCSSLVRRRRRGGGRGGGRGRLV